LRPKTDSSSLWNEVLNGGASLGMLQDQSDCCCRSTAQELDGPLATAFAAFCRRAMVFVGQPPQSHHLLRKVMRNMSAFQQRPW
jgi:hypothetical protein